METRRTLLLVPLVLGLTLLGCGPSLPALDAGPTPPAIRVTDLEGLQRALLPRGDERGVLLNLWATW